MLNDVLGSPVYWISEEDYLVAGGSQEDWDADQNLAKYGPITANKYLASQTSDWGVVVQMPIHEQLESIRRGGSLPNPHYYIRAISNDFLGDPHAETEYEDYTMKAIERSAVLLSCGSRSITTRPIKTYQSYVRPVITISNSEIK